MKGTLSLVEIPPDAESQASYALQVAEPVIVQNLDTTPRSIDVAVRDLAMIGLDRVVGYFTEDALRAWTEAGNALETLDEISPEELREMIRDGYVHYPTSDGNSAGRGSNDLDLDRLLHHVVPERVFYNVLVTGVRTAVGLADREVGRDLGQQARDHELGQADAESADGQGDQAEDQHPDHGEDVAAQRVHGRLSFRSTAVPTGKGLRSCEQPEEESDDGERDDEGEAAASHAARLQMSPSRRTRPRL